jgi:hypothetical protein
MNATRVTMSPARAEYAPWLAPRQFAARYLSQTSVEIRPRGDTAIPLDAAHSRTCALVGPD